MSDYKYCWGYEKDDMEEFANNIEQCMREAAKYRKYGYDATPPEFVYIAEYEPYDTRNNPGFGYYLLEYYVMEAEEHDSSWLEDVSDEDEKLLDKMLSETFKKWCKKTGHEPHFGTIENIKKYSLATGKEIK